MNTVHHLCLSSSPLDAKEYSRRFNVASKQSIMPEDAKDNYAYDWTKYKKSTGPTFDRSEMVQNVTVEKGQTAYLPCMILNQEHFTVRISRSMLPHSSLIIHYDDQLAKQVRPDRFPGGEYFQ